MTACLCRGGPDCCMRRGYTEFWPYQQSSPAPASGAKPWKCPDCKVWVAWWRAEHTCKAKERV